MMRQALTITDRLFPAAKRSLPLPIRKRVMRRYFANADAYDSLPERQWIRNTLLPAVAAAKPRRVVFGGAAPYTFQYEEAFDAAVTEYITIDSLPAARVWGARRHIEDRIENLERHLDRRSVDVCMLIGVYGFGTNTLDEYAAVLSAAHGVLAQGACLVATWNSDIHEDPSGLAPLGQLYEHRDAYGLPARSSFGDAALVVDLYAAI